MARTSRRTGSFLADRNRAGRGEHRSVVRDAPLEARDVAALWQGQKDRVGPPVGVVVPLQPVTQPRRFRPDDGIGTWVERGPAPQGLHPQGVLLELIGAPVQGPLDDEAQKRAGSLGATKRLAAQHALQLLHDRFSLDRRRRHGWEIATAMGAVRCGHRSDAVPCFTRAWQRATLTFSRVLTWPMLQEILRCERRFTILPGSFNSPRSAP